MVELMRIEQMKCFHAEGSGIGGQIYEWLRDNPTHIPVSVEYSVGNGIQNAMVLYVQDKANRRVEDLAVLDMQSTTETNGESLAEFFNKWRAEHEDRVIIACNYAADHDTHTFALLVIHALRPGFESDNTTSKTK